MLYFHNLGLFYNPQIYETYREIQTQSLDEKKRISYLCIEIVLLIMRELIYSPDYLKFEKNSSPRTLEKLRYATVILETVNPIPSKFVKKLTNTDFYEMRISVNNEVRIILFSADNENINLAKCIIFLNGFIKKSTKDYEKAIDRAINILRTILE